MSQISYIKYKDIKEARRYDAEYFKPEYLKIEKKIKAGKFTTVGNVTKLFVKGIFDINADVYTSFGVPFVRISNLKNLKIDDNDIVYIPTEENLKNKKTELHYGDIVLSKTAYPACSLVTLEQCNVSQDTIAVKLKNDTEVLSPYVVVFLNTNYGMEQMRRYFTGNIQMHLNLTESRQILIPVFSSDFQKKVAELFNVSLAKQTQSKQLYREAEELLLKELGLLNYLVKNTLAFSTTKKEVEQAHRYDSEYFQPKYEEIIEKIEKYDGGFDVVKNQFKQNTTLSKKDGDYCNYIEISDVNVSNGEIITNRVEIKDIPANGKRKLFKNDLLISKVRPYRGAISFIDFEPDNLLGSGAFTVLQEKTDYKKETLMIFLKTFFIKDLLLRYNCGTSYPVIKDEDILNLKIPLIKPHIQKQIAEKIQESHKLRKESKALLEEAKRKVEEEIEKKI